jgi:hypothetical protein
MSTPKPMASTASLPAENPQKSILEDGVFCAEDPIVGKRVDEIAQRFIPVQDGRGIGLLQTQYS